MMKENTLVIHNENDFQKSCFERPSVRYAPMYMWRWNGKMNREETDRQLEEMKRLGIKAFYILPEPKNFRPKTMPTLMEPEYLTKAYFEEYLYVTQKASEMGMTIWLYDEGGWPSGGACGRVLLEYPEYAKQILASKKVTNSDGEEVTEYYAKPMLFVNEAIPDFPDITRKEAVDAFVEIGLESYKPYLQEYFGNTITMVFSDEAAMARPVLFREELERLFEKRNGYSIRPYLAFLAGDKPVTEKEAALARIAWYDMCSDLFCENYLLTEKKWANENGMAFTGHFGGEDQIIYNLQGGYGNIMRALRSLDVPGIDVIWRQIHLMDNPSDFHPVTGISGQNRVFPRFASSAAVQTGKNLVMTESCGVYGAGLTFEQMRYIFNYQALRGVNIYNICSFPYAREGFMMTGVLPFYTEKHACYQDLPVFNAYMERLSYVASLGQIDHSIALYMPIRDIWAGERSEFYDKMFDRTAKEMEDAHLMYDVFDDDVIKRADPDMLLKGIIAMGNARYTTLVLPACKYLPAWTVEGLQKFAMGGGRVIMTKHDEMPTVEGAEVVEGVSEVIKATVTVTGTADKIHVDSRKLNNGRIYMILNEKTKRSEFEIELEASGSYVYSLDLLTGKIHAVCMNGKMVKLVLEAGEMAVLLCTDEVLAAEETVAYRNEYMSLHDFKFRRSKRFVIGEKTYDSIEICEDGAKVSLGDWSTYVGKEFSGSGIYETTFRFKEVSYPLCLDLGEVHHTCEVFLNGQSLGVCVMAPYRYVLPAELLQEENTLQIRVSNTAANEYNYTKSFDKWQKWQLSPYWDKEKLFHEDSMSGGLYGPVRIMEKA